MLGNSYVLLVEEELTGMKWRQETRSETLGVQQGILRPQWSTCEAQRAGRKTCVTVDAQWRGPAN